MDIKKRDFLGLAAGVGAAAAMTATVQAQPAPRLPGAIQVGQRRMVNENKQPSTVDRNYKPRRLNKVIELWEDGQPMYYADSGLGTGRRSLCAGREDGAHLYGCHQCRI